jgi:predicted molibdopterin-dependent oxidoreductase YjgC
MIPGWRFLAAVAAELGSDLRPDSPADVFDALSSEVAFYDTLTYEEIGGKGLRWGERDPGKS